MSLPRNLVWRGLLAAIFGFLCLSGAAQRDPVPIVRIDAYGWVRWRNAPIDPSRGADKYHFRLNAANGGRTTGGFGVSVPGRLNGTIHELRVDPSSIKQNASGPPRAKALGRGEFAGRHYRIEAEVVGDYSRPAGPQQKRGVYVPGTVRFRLIGPLSDANSKASGPVQEAASVDGTQVRFEIRWRTPRGRSGQTGGAMRPPTPGRP